MIMYLCIYLVMVRILLSGEYCSRASSIFAGYINHQETMILVLSKLEDKMETYYYL
jgi:hypothetical protein